MSSTLPMLKNPFSSKAVILIALLGASVEALSAQAASEALRVDELQSALAAVSSAPNLAAWKTAHSRERVDLAHYETDKDSYEIDFAHENQWCATAVADIAPGVTRAASFYVPEVAPGQLAPLPSKQDASLTGSCRLGAMWYQARGPNLVNGLVQELTRSWGPPGPTSRKDFLQNVDIRGSGLWKDVTGWRRGAVHIWIAWTDWDKGNGIDSRTIVWIAAERPKDLDLFAAGFDVATSASKMAGLSPELTAQISPDTDCARLDHEIAVGRLSRWLTTATSLPAERRAAALVAADSFVPCVLESGGEGSSLAALGVKLETTCPQDGPDYTGSLLKQAEALDPSGPAGALAAVSALQAPCSLSGSGPWPQNVLNHGERILREFKPGPWSPWVHFALARAHDVKLSFSLPPGEADVGVIHHLTPTQAEEERSRAVAEFALFMREEPDTAEAVFAWQEAWRLLAGLPPSPTHFGCNCE